MLATNNFRPARAFAIRFQPAVLASCSASAAPFSTTTRPTKVQRTDRPFFASSKPSPVKTTKRYASSASGASAAAANPKPTTSSRPTQLTWNDYFALRRTRRRINLATSGVTAIATTYSGLRVFIDQGYDSTLSASFNLDPLMVTGLSTFIMLGAGWLLGPIVGNAVFNMRLSAKRGEFLLKEREFFDRIKRHRADPTSSSMANPVPDYYGEKIGSVAGYRRWLKDQRAFNLKRGAYQGNK